MGIIEYDRTPNFKVSVTTLNMDYIAIFNSVMSFVHSPCLRLFDKG